MAYEKARRASEAIEARIGAFSGLEREAASTMVTPNVARSWLLQTHRATEVNGRLVLGDREDPASVVGLTIAEGDEPRSLTEMYRGVLGRHCPFTDHVLEEMAQAMQEEYS